jgi:hypothetical protein
LSFFVSPLADAPTQDAILQLLEAAVRLPAGQKALLRYYCQLLSVRLKVSLCDCRQHGLLAWLTGLSSGNMLGSYTTPLVSHIVRGCGMLKTITSFSHQDSEDEADANFRQGLNAVVGTDTAAQRLAAVCLAYTRDLLRVTAVSAPCQPITKRPRLEEQEDDVDPQAVASIIGPDQLLRAGAGILGVLKSLCPEAGRCLKVSLCVMSSHYAFAQQARNLCWRKLNGWTWSSCGDVRLTVQPWLVPAMTQYVYP